MATGNFNPTQKVTIAPKRAIGPFSMQVTISESATDTLEVTQHPVQLGATISDHAFVKPAQLSVAAVFAPDADYPLARIYDDLLKVQAERVPLDVITGKRSYKNMLIVGLKSTTDADSENLLSVQFKLLEVKITRVTTAAVPPRSRHNNPGSTAATKNSGSKSAVKVPEPPKTLDEQLADAQARSARHKHGMIYGTSK